MKKLLALILVLTFILSLTACGNKAATVSKTEPPSSMSENNASAKKETTNENQDEITVNSENESTNTTPDTNENISSDISLEDIKSFDDFVEAIDKSDREIIKTENSDGSIVIDMTTPTTDKDTDKKADKPSVPAVPTIDKVKPTAPEKTEKTEEEEKPSAEDNTPTVPEKEPETEDKTPQKEEETAPEVPTEPQKPSKPVEEVVVKKPEYTYTTGQKHTKLPFTERYLYSLLDEEKKGWYRAIDKAVNNLEEEAVFNASMAENRNYYIYYLYMFDNPEHFYLGNSVTIYNYGDGRTALVFCYSDGKLTCRFGGKLTRINDELRAGIRAKKAIFDAEVERIISTIPNDAPVVVKEKLIYDRILIDSHYNLSAKWDGIAEDNWTAYGILVNKYGVCESYSEAFQTLCLAVGINCTGVVGTAGGGHKWNCVELDDEWYMCDITFDDPIGGDPDDAYHFYFNLTSAKMKEFSHDWSDSNWPVPECTGTKYSYSYFN